MKTNDLSYMEDVINTLLLMEPEASNLTRSVLFNLLAMIKKEKSKWYRRIF